jgi:hypothetical protein
MIQATWLKGWFLFVSYYFPLNAITGPLNSIVVEDDYIHTYIQLTVTRSGMWDVRVEARQAGSTWGDTVQSFGVANWTSEILII